MGPATDKLVILARGLGTRMRQGDARVGLSDEQNSAADQGIKAMVPVGRPFLDYVLSAVAGAGVGRVCLVVGPEHEAIRDYYGRQVCPDRLEIEFAVQPQPRGTADAVLAAEKFAAGDPFLVINSDNYYPVAALRSLLACPGSATAVFDRQCMLADGNLSEERLRAFAVVEIAAEDRLQRIIEKPDADTLDRLPSANWISMNCWRFGPSIFEAARAIEPSSRGELEIPSAVQYAIEVLGETFQVITIHEAVLDLSRREDIEPVTARLASMEVDF